MGRLSGTNPTAAVHELTSGMDAMVAGGGDWRGKFITVTHGPSTYAMNSIPRSAWRVGSRTLDPKPGGRAHPAPGLVQLGSVKCIKWGTAVGGRGARKESQSGAAVGFIGMPCVW